MAPTKSQSKRRKKLLSNTRPRSVVSKSTLSSQQTRTIIRKHHTLHKRLAQAERSGDSEQAASVRAELEASGGLATYQQASTQGQAATRGGDSSRVLVEWFRKSLSETPSHSKSSVTPVPKLTSKSTLHPPVPMRLLEVGALRIDNACARSGLFAPTRIDLRSNHAEILAQDFMQRPLPAADAERFDVVSLSLVLNYVSEPEQRGAMLQRVGAFLRHQQPHDHDHDSSKPQFAGCRLLLPGLFLVLPAPCVRNSRYLDESRLLNIMAALGHECVHKKYSDKLAYFYLRYTATLTGERFAKKEIVKGAARNNFAIVLK